MRINGEFPLYILYNFFLLYCLNNFFLLYLFIEWSSLKTIASWQVKDLHYPATSYPDYKKSQKVWTLQPVYALWSIQGVSRPHTIIILLSSFIMTLRFHLTSYYLIYVQGISCELVIAEGKVHPVWIAWIQHGRIYIKAHHGFYWDLPICCIKCI